MPTKQQIANIHLWSINCLVLGAVSLLFSAYINANDLNILPKEHGFEPDIAFIPAGTFQMGNLVGDDRWGNETPIHSVKIQGFALGIYEVTFAEFDAFTQATGYKSAPDYETWGRGSHPVINVSWEDAQAYIDWLSKTTGRSYRLPSEAEWEYAARAGTTTAYSWGDDFEHYNQANCYGCNREWLMSTTPVGSFEANKFGLYDMAGNVSEWTQDCLNMDYHGAPSDGSAWESGDCQRRITRGGGWDTIPLFLRPANRGGRVKFAAKKRFDFLGFRVAMDLDKK